MSDEETSEFSIEELNSLVDKHKELMSSREWELYLFTKKQDYMFDRKNNLGIEYEYNSQTWDSIFEREWLVMEERLSAGLGVERDIIHKFGDDFFKSKEELLEEVSEITKDLETMTYKDNKNITIYTYEDFNLLSNQGIFRDSVFILDPQSKWKKKVVDNLRVYGYKVVETMNIGGDKYLLVSKKEEEEHK